MIAGAMRTPSDVAALLLINLSGNWWSTAAKLKCPVLYVVSGDARAQAAQLGREVPSAVVEVLDGAGHALFVDDPTHFNGISERFIESLVLS
jgi:pimeloyl-ACP methyl ester carboxylesterase